MTTSWQGRSKSETVKDLHEFLAPDLDVDGLRMDEIRRHLREMGIDTGDVIVQVNKLAERGVDTRRALPAPMLSQVIWLRFAALFACLVVGLASVIVAVTALSTQQGNGGTTQGVMVFLLFAGFSLFIASIAGLGLLGWKTIVMKHQESEKAKSALTDRNRQKILARIILHRYSIMDPGRQRMLSYALLHETDFVSAETELEDFVDDDLSSKLNAASEDYVERSRVTAA